jgi:hypothetical protein
MGREETWFDDDAGPVVRPYAVTRGRTKSNQTELELITLVMTASSELRLRGGEPEYANILRLCQTPVSVAEIAARLNLPVGVVKVLVSDLIEQRYLVYGRNPVVGEEDVLHAVLDGIRRL